MIKPMVVTNGRFTREARKAAIASGVELLDQGGLLDILKLHPCTHAELARMADQRKESRREVEAAVLARVRASA